MPRSTIFCNHYRAMSDHATCKVGVAYDSFKGLPFEDRPCFWRYRKDQNAGCSLMEMPTPEQLAAEEEESQKRFEMICKARAAIVAHIGEWKPGMPRVSADIDCPACGGKETLRFSRASVNGHIHARCETDNCVNWME